jgi:UDP-N-acetyl-2-amino-2-deoxyglucuronate dehydrogenase
MKNFAMIGVAGYIAPRHLQAIKNTGNRLLAVTDPFDAVGILDRYFSEVAYFREFERFDRHLDKLRRESPPQTIDYVTICSPNYLHDAHIRFALRINATPICEKPLVLNPWNLDALEQLEKECKRKIHTILQLRCHPSILRLKEQIHQESRNRPYDIDLTYITPRGKWYDYSWKGDVHKSGGIEINIGIHFFDMLMWIFGALKKSEVHQADSRCKSGYLELDRARIRWFLSINREDLPGSPGFHPEPHRSIVINGQELEFSGGFSDLHTAVYRRILKGEGYGISDVRPVTELLYRIRTAEPVKPHRDQAHPLLAKSD